MNFSSPERVLQTIRAGDTAEYVRGQNRQKITDASNNKPPLPDDLAKQLGIKINVNWGEMMILLAHACRQYVDAFWKGRYFFQVKIPDAPLEKRAEWEGFITEKLNKIMRDSLSYFELHRSMWKAVVAFGQGPSIWENAYSWKQQFVAVEDLRIAADTTLDFENLDWFSRRRMYTPGELVKKVFTKKEKNGWDRKGVAQILKNYKEVNYDFADNKYDWDTAPEKLAEMIRQDGGYYSADAMPGIPLWHFYFRDEDANGDDCWYMRVVPEQAAVAGAQWEKFLYTDDKPFAQKREHILHCQFGDLNSKPPFMYQSVRSLGFALMEPCFYDNLTICRLLQHVHDQFNAWFRVIDPVDKARAVFQELGNMTVIKQGVSVVPGNERHQVDTQLVEFARAQTKQLMNEASATYTQQPDTGTNKEQTAFETSVKVQQVNAMLSGLLQAAFMYAKFGYKENCRRFCLQHPKGWDLDEDVVAFQKACKRAEIPRLWLNTDLWEIEPEQPLGMGNPTMAMAESQALLGVRPMLDPTAQQEALHDALVPMVGAKRAARWVNVNRKGASEAAKAAEADFSVLMHGVPVQMQEGNNPIEQVEVMLGLMAGVITRIESQTNLATPGELAGLQTVAQHIQQLIQALSQDKAQVPRAKSYSQALSKLMNSLKGFAQRLQQQQAKAGENGNGETASKIQERLILAQSKAKISEATAKQKMRQGDQKLIREERRRDASTFAELQRQNIVARNHRATME